MSPLTLALAFHNHQPVGNFGSVFEQAYERAYEPMVSALERHPNVRVALHYSGPLLDWLAEARPELIDRVRVLVRRGQAEIMTGGYYEPILPAIPDRDKRGQIAKLTKTAHDLFGYDPTGLWLAERVWEPYLPRPLARAGVGYTIVDDTHFYHVGLTEPELTGHFITEEGGEPLSIFPSLKSLRYRIPWQPVSDLMAWLRDQAAGGADPDRILVMGDDGEKFGLWPGTFALCWEKGWVEAFFSALDSAREWLTLALPAEWIGAHPPRGRIYLPTASYDEMTEWALPADAAALLPSVKHDLAAEGREGLLRFMQGGFWRHFLVKYPEINTLHKTMLRVSGKVWRMHPGPDRDAALESLWKGQCNCPYWHGVFGGAYLGHIRAANYRHLIRAEEIADRRERPGSWVAQAWGDYDADGRPEILVRSDAQVITIDPADGGSVVAWDVRGAGVNLANVMTRRPEGYHQTLRAALARGDAVLVQPGEEDLLESIHTERVRVREPGLGRFLIYDWYRRSGFLDHLLEPGGGPAAFATGRLRELGDFVNQPYTASQVGREPKSRRRGPRHALVRLVRDGHLWAGDYHAPVRIEKTFAVPPGQASLEVAYKVTNRSTRSLRADFAVETNWGVSGPAASFLIDEGRAVRRGVGELFLAGTSASVVIDDPEWAFRVRVGFPAASVWGSPIEVVSASEAGFERTFQGASLLLVWPLSLEPEEAWETRVTVRGGTDAAPAEPWA